MAIEFTCVACQTKMRAADCLAGQTLWQVPRQFRRAGTCNGGSCCAYAQAGGDARPVSRTNAPQTS